MKAEGYVLEELLDLAKAAADSGAAVLAERANEPLEIVDKSEAGEIVTNIDLAAERAVRKVILGRRPGDAITGEELGEHANIDARVRWSVDPLDGTTNYPRQSPYYCTSVAAIDIATKKWLVGAVVAPALGRTYFASRGGGAWLSTARGTQRLHGPLRKDSSRLLGLGFSYSQEVRETQFAAIAELMASFTDIRSLGSGALSLCEIADGRLDAYVESDFYEYDWAAGALIAEEAGVAVTRPKGPGLRGGITTAPFNGEL